MIKQKQICLRESDFEMVRYGSGFIFNIHHFLIDGKGVRE